jgi:hypothetical protein
MARRKLASDKTIGDATAFETANFQPGSNTLILLFVTSARPPFGGGIAGTPTVTGNGLQWIPERSVLYGANNDRRLTLFRASGAAPVAGAAVIDFGLETQDFCAWSIIEYTDVDVSTANGKSAIVQSFPVIVSGQSLTASLSPSADPNRNFAVGAIAVDSTAGAAIAVTEGAGFTEIDEQDLTQFLGKAGTLQTQDAAASNTAISWTWNSPQSAAALVLEVKAAPPSDGGGGTGPGEPGTEPADDRALVERFEPVLFFHPSEKFFPSDAKRYVEHAALWTGQTIGDDKAGWGGNPGDPFPRNPTVPALGLAALADEPGDFRFDDQLGAGNDHRFLELGGWKDLNETHEAGVTAQSTNVYSDRSAIEDLYKGVLEPSRFWYHAEVIHEKQLRVIASRASGVDLSPVVDKLRAPALLCYYFLFPAHDQSVESDHCRGLEAREVSSHAGDWQCLAILGEGAGEAFTPKFLGRTGSRPGSGTEFPPYQFDDDQNTVMIVGAWTNADPGVSGGHPRIYVAAGTHSLYTTPGPQMVDPYAPGEQPQYCGTLDAPSPAGPTGSGTDPNVEVAKDMSILLAKMVAGGAFGFLGATAALVSCVVEIGHYRAPFEPFGAAPDPNSPADPDQPPAGPGLGKTVKPERVSVSDAGADVVDWRCKPSKALTLDGRVYDCIVDRKTQPWWPNPDTKSGFNGRWGQHVTADSLSRRAGPRFPNYPLMFLQAVADGVGRTPPLLKLDG